TRCPPMTRTTARIDPSRGASDHPVPGAAGGPARAKAPRSASQQASSRLNGARSREPKTDRGKQISRMNSLKRGLRAELPVLPGEDPEALQYKLDLWMLEQDPRTDLERQLVEDAVHASWRLERCRYAEADALTRKMEAIAAQADDRDARAVEDLASLLDTC